LVVDGLVVGVVVLYGFGVDVVDVGVAVWFVY